MEWCTYLQSCKVNDARDATHLSMIGGKYNFSNKKLFHTMYVLYLQEASKHCLMECARYPIRFFIDIDRCTLPVLDHLKHRLEECVVCFNGTDGYHLIFPSIVVKSKQEAIQTMNQWKDSPLFPYMDSSVYATGLRMIGAHKSKTIERTYNPIGWIHPKQGDRFHYSSTYQPNMIWLQGCSIQTDESKYSKSPKEDHGYQSVHSNTLSLECLDSHYKHVPVYRFEKKNHRYVHILTYDKYCTNVQRYHTNQHVYFVMDCQQKTIMQRCFGCKHQCNTYKSKFVKLPISIFYKIYNSIV